MLLEANVNTYIGSFVALLCLLEKGYWVLLASFGVETLNPKPFIAT